MYFYEVDASEVVRVFEAPLIHLTIITVISLRSLVALSAGYPMPKLKDPAALVV
tara:strand:- start:2238 stop:2399 length:162 start_codon:yes stop_codon:yes gene_type:complete